MQKRVAVFLSPLLAMRGIKRKVWLILSKTDFSIDISGEVVEWEGIEKSRIN